MCVGPLCPGAASCEPLLVAVVAFGVAAGWQAAGGPGVAGNPEIAGNYCGFCLFFFFPTMEGAWENRCDFIATSLLFVLPEAGGLAGSKVYAEHRESSAQKTWSVVLAMLLSLCGAPGWTSGRERGA